MSKTNTVVIASNNSAKFVTPGVWHAFFGGLNILDEKLSMKPYSYSANMIEFIVSNLFCA